VFREVQSTRAEQISGCVFFQALPLDTVFAGAPIQPMSGSNSGREAGGGVGGAGGEGFDCQTLVERTSLSSPVPGVVSKLKDGDQLQVAIDQQGGVEVLQALDSAGAVAGSLVPRSLPRFIKCINEGFEYVAVVQQRDGGRVRVEIRPGAQ
jgi:hypothetical protein